MVTDKRIWASDAENVCKLFTFDGEGPIIGWHGGALIGAARAGKEAACRI